MSRLADDILVSPDDPDALVPVAAGELFEWAWLADELADWLAHAADTTAFDFARYFPAGPTRHGAVHALEHIHERIGALLDRDRGQP